MRKIAYSSLIVLFISCQPNLTDEIDGQLKEVFEQFELMGLSVGLIANGELSYSGSFGLANEAQQLPMTADTYLRIASISKFYTSLAVMQLWEQGLVDLDTPASVYLGWELKHPAFPDQAITLRHLMDHRSGIRDGAGYAQFSRSMLQIQGHIRALFMPDSAYYTEDMFSEYAPGAYFSYTNCTWGLVASIVESVSNQRFDKYCKEHLFEPMGMNSSFNVIDIPAKEMAALYRYGDGAWEAQVDDFSATPPVERVYANYEPGVNGLIYGPQGSLRTSLNDLWLTARMLLNEGKVGNKSIVKPETLSYFQQGQWKYNGENGDTWNHFWYAYTKGMHFITNTPEGDIIFPDRSLWGHPGIAYGLLSDFYIDPDTQSGVIFITNGSKKDYAYAETSSFYEVEEAVFKILHPHLIALEAQ